MADSTVAPTSARAGRRRPGRPKGGGVVADRAQLLAAAERTIRSKGLDTTMNDVAEAAGVSKPILYRTVGDKDTVVDALSDVLVERIATTIERTVTATGNGRADFERAVRCYLAAVDADRNLFLFVNASGHRPEQLRQRISRSARQLVDMFSAAPGSPTPHSSTAARTWGYAIVGALQTVTTMWFHDDDCDLDELAADVTQLLWPGVRDVLA